MRKSEFSLLLISCLLQNFLILDNILTQQLNPLIAPIVTRKVSTLLFDLFNTLEKPQRSIMRSFSSIATLLLASTTLAHPVEKRQAAVTDVDILQYALTLEHLENVFYKGAVSTMSEQDFVDAGFSAAYYQNLLYITFDEEQHVELLTSSLSKAGAAPVAACTYDFPYTDPKSFVTLASVLEGVGYVFLHQGARHPHC